MVKLAEQFYQMGYAVSKADDYLSVTTEDGVLKVLMVNIEFARGYVEDVFPNLPEGFTYYYYPAIDANSCRIIHHENYFSFGKLTNTQAVKAVINRLYKWAVELEKSGYIDIYRLAGLI